MYQTWILIKREYLQRVRKRSFVIMTLLGPVFFALLMIVPLWLSTNSVGKSTEILILDKKGWFEISETQDYLRPILLNSSSDITLELTNFLRSDKAHLIYISEKGEITNYSKNNEMPGLNTWIRERVLKNYLLENSIEAEVVSLLIRGPKIDSQLLSSDNQSLILTFLSIISGILIYIFIIAYTMQVMRGVVEEKANRITELLITSVSPLKIMTGKIIGIGLVCLTQFGIWIVLCGISGLFLKIRYGESISLFSNKNIEETLKIKGIDTGQALEWNAIIGSIESINFIHFGLLFLFFFIIGYLFYSSIFAAVGAAVDAETETQQFSFPLTLPILICFTAFETLIYDPDSSVAIFFSIFPLTSPVAIMILYPSGIPTERLFLSMAVLLISLAGMIWISSRIYRTAILMYGKKASLLELIKWAVRN